MKRLGSFLLGAVMLFGAATLGLPSGSASAKDKHDCAKRNKMGHCEQWSAKPATAKPAEAKH